MGVSIHSQKQLNANDMEREKIVLKIGQPTKIHNEAYHRIELSRDFGIDIE